VNVIEVNELVKHFGDFHAVNGISFSVREGEIFGFLGPNGAGKTTTIKMLTARISPTSGSANVAGFDSEREKDGVRRSIGVVFQETSLDESMTAFENLYFHAVLYGVAGKGRKARINELLSMVELYDDWRNVQVKTFSGGMKRRLEIVRSLLHAPKVLFLDEPTLGLDVQTRALIWEHLRAACRDMKTSILLTTHNMEEAECADRVAIIDNGKIIALDTPQNLKRLVGGKDVIMIQTEDNEKARECIEKRWGIVPIQKGSELFLETSEGASFIPVLIHELPVEVTSVMTRRTTLEDVFIHLTGKNMRDVTDEDSGFFSKLGIGG